MRSSGARCRGICVTSSLKKSWRDLENNLEAEGSADTGRAVEVSIAIDCDVGLRGVR
jgi:hypothetical protein